MVLDTEDLFRDLPITTFYHATGGVSLDRDRRSVVYVTDNGDNISRQTDRQTERNTDSCIAWSETDTLEWTVN